MTNTSTMEKYLYKYLDCNGGLGMLFYGNLMFTNATNLNDPFDCHQGLIDFSKIPKDKCRGIPKEFMQMMEYKKFENFREKTWLCSLSKVYDSLLMWSYYNSHKGVCIGIDMEKARPYLSKIRSAFFIGCFEEEVRYRKVAEKPVFSEEIIDFYRYQVCTKAKDWEHEHEVRLILYEPSPQYMMLMPGQENQEILDYKTVHAFYKMPGECFESLYLGVNIDDEDKKKMIKVAKKINSEIKIYQMSADTCTFKLIPSLI